LILGRESQKKQRKKNVFSEQKIRVEKTAVPFQEFNLPGKQFFDSFMGSRDLQLQDPSHLSNKKKLSERSQDSKSSTPEN